MKSEKVTERIIGILFITATVSVILTFFMQEYFTDPNYLVVISENEFQILIGMFLEYIWAFAVLGIPIVLYPILKKHNETLALGFFTFRLIEGIITIIGTLVLLTLLTLSKEFVGASLSASYYEPTGIVLLAIREWAFMIGPGIAFSLSAIILNYILFTSNLIPRWLSGWGLLGGVLAFGTYMLQFYNIDLEFLFIFIAVQEMAFAVWLIVKGFNSSLE
jgi:hypothetical protein